MRSLPEIAVGTDAQVPHVCTYAAVLVCWCAGVSVVVCKVSVWRCARCQCAGVRPPGNMGQGSRRLVDPHCCLKASLLASSACCIGWSCWWHRVDNVVAAAPLPQNDQLLAALSRDNSAFRSIFEIGAWRQACEQAAAGMRGQVKLFREVMDHLSEGLRFYMSLQVGRRGAVAAADVAVDVAMDSAAARLHAVP